ncbi:hypothetical protein BBP40_007498 [Aspergillus hancockii]|nr:hypothetical protein BBP40_007498 [Aspergillus hancockii]
MVVIGLWISKEESARSAAIDLHKTLDSSIREQREKWDASISEDASSSCAWPIPLYQAILNHTIFAIMHKGVSLGLDLKPSLPSADIELIESLVLSCKKLGMFYFPNVLGRYLPDDHPPYVWVSTEEIKRFNLALFRVCRTLSGSIKGDGDEKEGGAASWRLTAGELQFPMPKNDPLWFALRREEWEYYAGEDVFYTSLDNFREGEWISNSAELLRVVGS